MFVLWYLITSSVFDGFVDAQKRRTPLLVALQNDHIEIAQLLMEKGANIEAKDEVQLVANVY